VWGLGAEHSGQGAGNCKKREESEVGRSDEGAGVEW